MAVQPWKLYNMAKEYLLDNTIDIDGAIFRIGLYQSASNFATATLSTRSQVTNEVADGNGYSTSGKTLSATVYITGASASERRFDSTSTVWTAAGGAISNIKAAVIWVSGASAGAEKLLAYASLTSSQFNVNDGNSITIVPSANGIFEVN